MTPFEALAEPNRRRILDLLKGGEQPAGVLVAALTISQPGVSKHLKVLREAGLISVRVDAQRRIYRLEPARLGELDAWLAPYRSLRSDLVMPQPYRGVLIDERLGVARRDGATFELVFERLIARPVDAVWAALTHPARLANWLAQAQVELHVGGAFRLTFHGQDYRTNGVITALSAPHLLAWTWPHPNHPASVVAFELAANGEGSRLTLTQDGLMAADLVSVAGGWHTHLERLTDAVDGVASRWRPEREQEILKRYEGHFLDEA